MKLNRLFLLLIAAIIITAGCNRAPQLSPGNIDKVLKAMTLEEKASLVAGASADTTRSGIITTCPIERLGIPSITLATADTVAEGDQVRFPSPLALASSWDDALIESTSRAIGHQMLDSGVDILLEPSLNILRNPLGGNAARNFAEDPLLGGRSAAASVRGFAKSGIGSALKHFAAANQISYSDSYNACISQRTLREIYLKGFEIAIGGSQPAAVMMAGNKINGKWCSANPELTGTLLKDEWGFAGTVISDCDAAPAPERLSAGCDLLITTCPAERDSIISYAKDGRLTITALDSSARNVLKLIVSTPEFKKGEKREEEHAEPDLKASARQAAAEGLILLENRYAALPLTDSLQEQILIMEEASDSLLSITPALEAALTDAGCSICHDADSADVALVVISRRSPSGDRVASDFHLTEKERNLIETTCTEFHAEDKFVVVVLNIDAVIETASWKDLPDAILLAFDSGSETPDALADVISGAVNPCGHLTVTFPNSLAMYPSMFNFPFKFSREDQPKDITSMRGAPPKGGMRPPSGGVMLFRQNRQSAAGNPERQRRDTSERARRFRSMFMLSAKDSADRASMGVRNKDYFLYQEGLYVGYRFFSSFGREVSYPFGHGLSYTSFDYGDPDVIIRRNSMKVVVDVTNTGQFAGRELLQVYVVTPESSLDKPLLSLVDYIKTPVLKPGERYFAAFTIPFSALASYNSASSAWSVDAGSYILKIGPSSADIRSEAAAVLDNPISVHTNDILQLNHRIDEMHLRRSIFRERGSALPATADSLQQENPVDSISRQ